MTKSLKGQAMFWRFAALACLIPLSGLLGCGPKAAPPPKTPPTFPVTGVVHIDGKPTAGVKVMLFPGNEEIKIYNPIQGSSSQGLTDESGKFSITTFYANDGAPVGDYKVLLYWPGKTFGMPLTDPDNPAMVDPTAGRFNKKYGDPRKPFKTIKVEDGKPTDMGTLDLKTK